MAHRFFDYSALTPAERVELAMELWDSLPDDSLEPPLTEAQKAVLGERLAELRRNPNAGSAWEEVRGRIERRFRGES
jgi:putative addiction module component (TIGR02574 family)